MMFPRHTARKGFTLIELLVVISIIGLLSTLAVVSLNSARVKARDAKRLADLRQVQTALELFFNDQSYYPGQAGDPTSSIFTTLGVGSYACLHNLGFAERGCDSPYMGIVPTDPGVSGTDYLYQMDGENLSNYSITFSLEGTTGSLPAGEIVLTPAGFQKAPIE